MSNMTKEELSLMKEKFVVKYSKSKGWNPEKLSTNQMLEIVSQRQFKTLIYVNLTK